MSESGASESISGLSSDVDEEACLQAYYSLEPRLINLLMRFGLLREDAENIIQDVAMKVFCGPGRRIHSYNPSLCFRKWVTSIAVNLCCDALRKQRRRIRPLSMKNEGLIVDAKYPTPLEEVIHRDSSRYIENVASGLSGTSKQIMIDLLRGRTTREITEGALLWRGHEITRSTAKWHVRRTREKMQSYPGVRSALGLD